MNELKSFVSFDHQSSKSFAPSSSSSVRKVWEWLGLGFQRNAEGRSQDCAEPLDYYYRQFLNSCNDNSADLECHRFHCAGIRVLQMSLEDQSMTSKPQKPRTAKTCEFADQVFVPRFVRFGALQSFCKLHHAEPSLALSKSCDLSI
jgi:hypothetical protein